MKMCEYVVTTYIDTISAKEHLSVQDHRIFIRLVKCECFGICIEWMNNGLNDDITEDLQRFLEIGEDILKKLLH